MAQQTINIGASPNDGTGTPLRTAFQYTNSNFSELYTAVGPSGNNIVVPGSATITGDLTVRTNKLKVDATGVAIGSTSASYPLDVTGTSRFIGDAYVFSTTGGAVNSKSLFFGSAANPSAASIYSLTATGNSGYLNFATQSGGNQVERLTINDIGNFEFKNVGGVAGTAMTLNSTGLGLGTSPITALSFPIGTNKVVGQSATSSHAAGNVGSLKFGIADGGGDYSGIQIFNTHNGTYSSQDIRFFTGEGGVSVCTERMRITPSGNVLVGTTSALSAVSGSSQIALGGAGLQTTSQAISAATATTICRSGSGGVAIVAGYNGTGQYSAIVLFKYGGTTTSVIGSINDTGSTITYAISGANLQITSSLALTNLTVTCIRTA